MLTIKEMRQYLEQQYAERRRRYADFLRSPEWRAAAARVRERYHNLCCVCRGTENLETHHLSYRLPNWPEAPPDLPRGWLPMADAGLVLMCADCHATYHGLW